jgi:esterase
MLHHTTVTADSADPERWILFLHGIYGSGRNWGTIARQLVDRRPEWGVVLVDLRMHGRSQDFEPPHTVEAAATDLEALADRLEGRIGAVLGHSFGGKVALQYGADRPDGLAQVWVIDSTPATREPEGSAWQVLETVRALPDRFDSREEAVRKLEERGYPTGMAQWLATNLERDGDGYEWRLEWDAMEALLQDFFRTDLWPVVENPPGEVEIHFVKADDSETLDAEAVERVEGIVGETRHLHLHRLAGGHWLHADNPKGILHLLEERLP